MLLRRFPPLGRCRRARRAPRLRGSMAALAKPGAAAVEVDQVDNDAAGGMAERALHHDGGSLGGATRRAGAVQRAGGSEQYERDWSDEEDGNSR